MSEDTAGPKRDKWEIKEDISAIKRVKEIVLDKSRLKDIQDYIKEKEDLEDGLEDGDIAKALGLA